MKHDRGLVRLSAGEVRQAASAGYLTTPTNKRASSFFGSMFSWFSGVRFGSPTFWPAGGNSRPPVNAAESATGQIVTPSSALALSAFWACVWLNARTMASLPLDLKRYGANGKAELAEGEALYNILRWQPNADMSAFDFWTMLWANEQVWGTGYAKKLKSAGRVIGLEPLLSQYVTQYQTPEGRLRIRYDDPRNQQDFAAADVFRVFTRTLDGLNGCSVIEFARNSLGLAQAGERAAAQTFKKGLNATGFVEVEKFLTTDQREMFRSELDQFVGDGEKAGGTMVLEGGTSFKQLSMKPQDAELLNSRQFSVEDVCRWFNTPPILVGHASAGQTMWGSGVEQIFAGWARLSLRPFVTACTQKVRVDLIPAADRSELYAEYDLDDLLAADSQARAALYASLAQNGINTRDELRAREGLSPMPGGDQLTVQSNLVPLQDLGKITAGGGNAGGPAQKLRNALLELLAIEQPPPPKPPEG